MRRAANLSDILNEFGVEMDDDDEKDICILILTKLTIVYTTESQKIKSTTMIRMIILSTSTRL